MLRDRVPVRYRRRLAFSRVALRQPTGRLRRLPSFAIIGAQRAGTSSLFRYLCAHPSLARPLRKETEYFSRYYGRSFDWYRAHFPMLNDSFEACPQYLLHPLVPQRFAEHLPEAKIVVTLRDPVERAFSHYHHTSRFREEPLTFAEAIDAEPARIAPDLERLSLDPLHHPRDLMGFSYLARSRYAEQLERWFRHVERSRVYVFSFDDFVSDPLPEWLALLRFLELPPWTPSGFPVAGATRPKSARVSAEVREQAMEHLADDLRRLPDLIDRPLSWLPT